MPVEPPPIIDAPAFEPAEIEEPQPRVIPPKRKPIAPAPVSELPLGIPEPASKPKRDKPGHAKQEVMQFEPVTRGRFEKSEPTIVEGQDLDVPTFLRKNVRVK